LVIVTGARFVFFKLYIQHYKNDDENGIESAASKTGRVSSDKLEDYVCPSGC
jgi:hypothetical protein